MPPYVTGLFASLEVTPRTTRMPLIDVAITPTTNVARFGPISVSVIVDAVTFSSVGHSSGSMNRSVPTSVRISAGLRGCAPWL
jgi:hypothetical protein